MLVGPTRLEWLEETLPAPGVSEVLVRTALGAVSVGTELPLYRGDARSSKQVVYPRMTGYESLARVVQVGERVASLGVGERVLASYGHRTAACLAEGQLIPVPEAVPDEVALLAILSCDASKGVGKLGLAVDDPVLITGAGTVGLLALHRLSWLGVAQVDVVEPDPRRRALALALGAQQAFAPDAYPGGEYAAGLECSSRTAAFALLQEAVRPGGRICVLADGNLEPLSLSPVFHERELSVVASSDGVDYAGHARAFFTRWLEHRPLLAALFEWQVDAARLPEAFARMLMEPPPLKVLVHYRSDAAAATSETAAVRR